MDHQTEKCTSRASRIRHARSEAKQRHEEGNPYVLLLLSREPRSNADVLDALHCRLRDLESEARQFVRRDEYADLHQSTTAEERRKNHDACLSTLRVILAAGTLLAATVSCLLSCLLSIIAILVQML